MNRRWIKIARHASNLAKGSPPSTELNRALLVNLWEKFLQWWVVR